MPKFFVGLDLGQAQDYTALCALERVDVTGDKPNFHARHLQRFKLGTSYPDIVAEVKKLMCTDAIKAGGYQLVADATGVGRPVVDLLRAAGLGVIAITITGGDVATKDDAGGWRVPKRDLVSITQVLLQTGRLKFAEAMPEVPVLVKELLSFQVKIDPKTAHDSYAVWREGVHDDLVLSVALACWWGNRGGGVRVAFV